MPELRSQLLFVLDAELHRPQMTATTPYGERRIIAVSGGRFEGARLRGQVLPSGGGDWALTRNDGTLELDVRLTLQTDDGALIHTRYRGVRHGPKEVLARLARGEEVNPEEYYFRTTPYFETGSEKYAWLNNIVAVGVGERRAFGPRYTVYEIM